MHRADQGENLRRPKLKRASCLLRRAHCWVCGRLQRAISAQVQGLPKDVRYPVHSRPYGPFLRLDGAGPPRTIHCRHLVAGGPTSDEIDFRFCQIANVVHGVSPCTPAWTIHADSAGHPLLLSRRRRRRGRRRGRDITTEDWTRYSPTTTADGRSAASDSLEFAVGEHSRGSGFDFASHRHLLQATADHPSLVRPQWRNALAAPVKRFTGGNPIRHFVMAITVTAQRVTRI